MPPATEPGLVPSPLLPRRARRRSASARAGQEGPNDAPVSPSVGSSPAETGEPGRGIAREARRPILLAFLIAAAALAFTADERPYGLVTDGQIMTRTAFSIAELGELGMARGHPVNVVRPAGDAVTRYGMGPSLVQVPIVFLAGSFERAFGVGSSQTLFVLAQLLWVLLASLAASGLVRAWGGSSRDAARALLATAVCSPLWGYVSSEFSEPLQAAVVGGSFVLAALATAPRAEGRRELLLAAAAGATAGFGLLTKSVFVVLLPAVVFVLFVTGRREARLRRVVAAAAGAAPLVATWLAFELVRFGRPFASYEGEHFNHPLLDGLLRLTLGGNKGLLLYFPLTLLAVWGALLLVKGRNVGALAPIGFVLFLLVTTAAWWSWDGTSGWGPRLLVPAVPLLAAFAALAAARLPALAFRTLAAAGLCVNALGALQPDSVTTWYYNVLPRTKLTRAEAARYPAFAVERGADGGPELLQVHAVHRDAAFSPIRLSAFLLGVRTGSADPVRALASPPWDTGVKGHEVATPPERAIPPSALTFLTSRFRWPHLGMSLFRRSSETDTSLAYLDCVFDQALRAQDLRDGPRAAEFGARLYGMVPGPQSAVAYAEGLRLAGRTEQLYALVRDLPEVQKSTPDFGLVWALLARDRGETDRAAKIMQRVVRTTRRPAVLELAALPPDRWPSTLREILRPKS